MAPRVAQQRRTAVAGGVFAVVSTVIRRAIIYPAIALGGLGAAVNEAQKHIPDLGIPSALEDLSRGGASNSTT